MIRNDMLEATPEDIQKIPFGERVALLHVLIKTLFPDDAEDQFMANSLSTVKLIEDNPDLKSKFMNDVRYLRDRIKARLMAEPCGDPTCKLHGDADPVNNPGRHPASAEVKITPPWELSEEERKQLAARLRQMNDDITKN